MVGIDTAGNAAAVDNIAAIRYRASEELIRDPVYPVPPRPIREYGEPVRGKGSGPRPTPYPADVLHPGPELLDQFWVDAVPVADAFNRLPSALTLCRPARGAFLLAVPSTEPALTDRTSAGRGREGEGDNPLQFFDERGVWPTVEFHSWRP